MTRRVVILETLAGPLHVLVLAASVWVLLRGHNEPGGGFIGGLVAASATVLWGIAHGSDAARRRLPTGSPIALAAGGVLLSALSGVPAWLAGAPYLTHQSIDVPLGFSSLWLSTVQAFDLGVYLSVWGAVGGYALGLIALDEETTARADGPTPPPHGEGRT